MECIIAKDCFEPIYQQHLSLLIKLVAYSSEFNSVIIEEPEVFENEGYNSLDKNDKDILEASFNANVIGNTTHEGETVKVTAKGSYEDKLKVFSPEEAVQYIKEPLYVLLENDLYDGRFIRCLIHYFGSKRVKCALEVNSIRMAHSGGCGNTKNTLNEKSRGFRFRTKFLRLCIVWDGDQEYPGKVVEKYNKDIEDLNTHGIRYHILCKREMENYLPEEAVKDLASPRFLVWFNAYNAMSDVQKDHYDMNDGFNYSQIQYSSANRDHLPDGVRELFADVSNTNFDLLKEGLKIGHFKDTFSKAFEISPYANKATLLARTASQSNPHELQEIADMINQLL